MRPAYLSDGRNAALPGRGTKYQLELCSCTYLLGSRLPYGGALILDALTK
jgi:hypothetical protein